jgi:hypothetical protein
MQESNSIKKLIHAAVLAVFSLGCLSTFGILTVVAYLRQYLRPGQYLPNFTTFCINLRPLVMALPILAAVYCVWVWFRKKDTVPSSAGFFAVAMGALVAVALPAILAAYLPLFDEVESLLSK